MASDGDNPLRSASSARNSQAPAEHIGVPADDGITSAEERIVRQDWKLETEVLERRHPNGATVTLDRDATEIIAHKADAQWTYNNKNTGCSRWWGTERRLARLSSRMFIKALCSRPTIIRVYPALPVGAP